MRTLVLLLAALTSPAAAISGSSDEVSLRIAESATVDEARLTISFEAVTRDNRCPKDVQCVVAGSAHVTLVASLRDGATEDLFFEVPPGGNDSVVFDVYTIRIARVDPQTRSSRRIEPGDYVVTVQVAKTVS
jgi:hypothetical protein